MSSYLKLNWVNQNEYPHIPPKYVLSDMIMEQFFKQANWRKVADPGSALEYINHCLQHHGMKELESKTWPMAYAAWKASYTDDFSQAELESAELLTKLKQTSQFTHKNQVNVKQENIEEEEKQKEEPALKQAVQLPNSNVEKPKEPESLHSAPPQFTTKQENPSAVVPMHYNHTNNVSENKSIPPYIPQQQQPSPHAFTPAPSNTVLQHNPYVATHRSAAPTRTAAPSTLLQDTKVEFKKDTFLFDLQILFNNQWTIVGSFQSHLDANKAATAIRAVMRLIDKRSGGHAPPKSIPQQITQNAITTTAVSEDPSTSMIYSLPTSKVIRLIHRLPAINLSDPWQLTQLVCLYLCLFARISINMLCSIQEQNVRVTFFFLFKPQETPPDDCDCTKLVDSNPNALGAFTLIGKSLKKKI